MSVVSINHLEWSYGEKKIIKDINLELTRGKFYAIVGPNGSGKTTLLKNILRHLSPKRDSIFVEGKDVMDYAHKKLAMEMASVPQSTEVSYDFLVYDIVMMGRSPYIKRFSAESQSDRQLVEEAMQITDTWHLKDKSIQEISGGERQRVIIARAIAQQSQLMLLDEPISNLDINHQVQVMDTVKKLCLERQLTVVTVLHDLNIAGQYADEIIFLKSGQVVEIGAPENVLVKPLISEVYGDNFHIIKNHLTDKPLIIPVSGIKRI